MGNYRNLPTRTPGFTRKEWNGRTGSGRILSNAGDPVVTHIHRFPNGGVGLSTYNNPSGRRGQGRKTGQIRWR